jgi:hypothetical protein
MPGNSREMIIVAERHFPVRILVAVPPAGLGQRHTQITAWLDENCGADGWAMTPSGTRGVLNDALSIYFAAATLASAFVARWCAGQGPRRKEACSRCERMGRRHGLRRGCIGHREAPGRPFGTRAPSRGVRGRDRRVPWRRPGPAARAPTPTFGAAHPRVLRRGVLSPTDPVRGDR